MKTPLSKPDLHLAFDVGHSSIGWAVLRHHLNNGTPEILGTGVVTFGADDCLAFKRRQYRQQRRHARSTRQRIARMEQLLAHLGVLTTEQLKARHQQAGGDSFAWQRAAEILRAMREGKSLPKVSWPELWDILRWYAHNRGYFAPPWANRGEDSQVADDDVPDTEKVKIAQSRMTELHTETMAETIAAYTSWYENEMAKWNTARAKAEKSKTSFKEPKPPHFKGLNAAFPRESVVWPEVRALLAALKGKLPRLDDASIRTLLGNDVDPLNDPTAWNTIPCGLKLPKRYFGGLLFGQMIPRFDNRIIGVCPIHFARRRVELLAAGFSAEEAKREAEKQSKLPAKPTAEFLRFRWAMQLANVFGARDGDPETQPLTADERKRLTEMASAVGALSKKEFTRAVHELTGWMRSNVANMLMHPDAEKALVLDPVQREIAGSKLESALSAVPEQYRKRLRGKLAKGKSVAIHEVRNWLSGAEATAFDAEVQRVLDAANTKKGRKQKPATREELLSEELRMNWKRVASGRAPYARPVLRQAFEEVMKGWDPRAEKNDKQPRGCLCQTNELKEAQLQRRLEEQTNNHLIRHRLMILERLLRDLITAPEFANGDKGRVAGLTIEVARDLRDLSGKTRKEQEQDLGIRLKDFKSVAKVVEEACARRKVTVTAGIIRKARVAEDLGWRCPYTGKEFSMDTLLDDGLMDKDHIIPHSDRQSDSLCSLVMTWRAVNDFKKKRTAIQFIRECGGQKVPGRAELSIMTLAEFQRHVDALDVRKGHDDDRNRKKRRVRRLLTENFEEKEFTPRDLTVTSHLVRLGAQVLLRNFPPDQRPPVVSLPGSVTGEVRKAWNLAACLEAANPAVMEEVEERDKKTGELKVVRRAKRKEEIRGITHLHHALDACVLGLASVYFPRNGSFWKTMLKAAAEREADDDRLLWLAMTKRRPTAQEAALLKATRLYKSGSDGRMVMDELPNELKEQIRRRLAEKRVVQHIPADMSGVKVEENTRGVIGFDEAKGRVLLRQRSGRDAKTGLQTVKPTDEVPGKLLGLKPLNGSGKLAGEKGVRVITDNFGVAILDHAAEGEEKFVVIPWHRVWHRLSELKPKNGGKAPRLIRNGMLIQVQNLPNKLASKAGVWRVFSVKQTLKLDLGSPDRVVMEDKGAGVWREVSLTTLGPERIQLLKASYAGIAH